MKVIVFFALLALAAADTPQTNNIAPTNLTSGSQFYGSVSLPTGTTQYYNVQTFSIWVPANAANVTVAATSLNEVNCYDLAIYTTSQNVIPCSEEQFGSSDGFFFCDQASYYDFFASTYSETYNADDSGYEVPWHAGRYWYLAVGSDSSGNVGLVCNYTLTVTVATCATYQVAAAESGTCMNVTQLNVTANTNTMVARSYGEDLGEYPEVMTFPVPNNVGYVTVFITSNYSSMYVYGRSLGAPTYEEADCGCEVGSSVNGTYNCTMKCYGAKAGNFYIAPYIPLADDGTITINYTISYTTCSNTSAGYNCNSTLTAFNFSNTSPINVTVASLNSASNEYQYPAVYYYVDIPANYTGPQAFFTVSVGPSGSEGLVSFLRDGFPNYDNDAVPDRVSTTVYSSSASLFGLNQFDWQVPGRLYMSFQCDENTGAVPCQFTIGSNGTSTSGTSGVTGATTASSGSTNDNSSSDANSVVVAFVALAVACLAAF